MLNRKSVLKSLKIGLACLGVLSIIGFVEKKHNSKVFEQVVIHITNQDGNFFVTDSDIQDLINHEAAVGDQITAERMTAMEQQLLNHPYIKRAEVYRDLKGKLTIDIEQRKPIARVIRQKQPDAYISTEGLLLPVTDRFSARVLLISGDYTSQLMEDSTSLDSESGVFQLAKYIFDRPFWQAQIAQLEIDSEGDVVMYPQVGKQVIEFGASEQLESKFARLDTFYKKILPKKGWNNYQRVSVKYTDQIICE